MFKMYFAQDTYDKHWAKSKVTEVPAKRPNQNDNQVSKNRIGIKTLWLQHFILSQEANGGKYSIIREPLHQKE